MKTGDWTNVLSRRFGPGAVDGLGNELGEFVVATMPLPWGQTRDRLGGNPRAVLMADSMEQDVLDEQVRLAPECDVVVAVGGGRAIDLGKYLAWQRGCRLVTIPTVLSVDAFVTPAAGVRVRGKVLYVGQASPDPLVIDYDLLRTAPRALNVAGVGDLLSIHTATADWELAERAGRSEFPFSAESVAGARRILEGIMRQGPEIRECTDQGLQVLVDGYMGVNRICLPAGHYRVEEGSEHYLFYALEEALGRSFIHGQIIGLGIYLMSRLQENRPEEMTQYMEEAQLRYHPSEMDLPRAALESALLGLGGYVRGRPDLWYTVLHEKPISPDWVAEVSKGLRFC